MKILVVGSGGREHAISWALAKSSHVSQIICVPGNGGTAREAKCRNVAGSVLDPQSLARIAKQEGCDLAVIGPEEPLALGAADLIEKAGIPVAGPYAQAARLEASKALAKRFMRRYGVACAESQTFDSPREALSHIAQSPLPLVIKADGLAAGKGVIIALTKSEAEAAVHELMEKERMGKAGKTILIEEYLRGREISVLAAVCVSPELTAQKRSRILPFIAAQDHKRLNEGASGPNTGGMGAIAPPPDPDPSWQESFTQTILEPTFTGLINEGYDYRGFIFFGLMLTEGGPRLLEYNVRLGDPETQAVLPLLDSDFALLAQAIAQGNLADYSLTWKEGFVCAPVAVSKGYPESYEKGKPIYIEEITQAKIFIAGAEEKEGRLISSGGRVLSASAWGKNIDEARSRAYAALDQISYEGIFYRRDIGLPSASQSY